MKLNLSAMLEVKNQKDDAVATLIESLLYQDARREKNLMTHFTYENPTLEDIIESRQLTLVVRVSTIENFLRKLILVKFSGSQPRDDKFGLVLLWSIYCCEVFAWTRFYEEAEH